jgi:hypothetical protein
MTHYGEEDSRVGRRERNGKWTWGDSGRALTRSPFLLCCKWRQLTTCSYVSNPHLLYLLCRELLEFLGHYGSLWLGRASAKWAPIISGPVLISHAQ